MGPFGGLSRFRKKPDGGGVADAGGTSDSTSMSARIPSAAASVGDGTASGGDTAANLTADAPKYSNFACGNTIENDVSGSNSVAGGVGTIDKNSDAGGAFASFDDGRPSTSGSHGFSNINNMMFSIDNLCGGADGAIVGGMMDGNGTAAMATLTGNTDFGSDGSTPFFSSFESRPSTSEGFQFGIDEPVEKGGGANASSLIEQDSKNPSTLKTEGKPSGGGGGIGFLKKRAAALSSQDCSKSAKLSTAPDDNVDNAATHNSDLAEINAKATEGLSVNNHDSSSFMHLSQISTALTGDSKKGESASFATVLGDDIAEEKSRVPHSISAKADAVEDDLTVGTINTEVLHNANDMELERSLHQVAESTLMKDSSGKPRLDNIHPENDSKSQVCDNANGNSASEVAGTTELRSRVARLEVAQDDFLHKPHGRDSPSTMPTMNQTGSDPNSTLGPQGISPVATVTLNQTDRNTSNPLLQSPVPPSTANMNNGVCAIEQTMSPLLFSEMSQLNEGSRNQQKITHIPDARTIFHTSNASIRGHSHLPSNDDSTNKCNSFGGFLGPKTNSGVANKNGPSLIEDGTVKKSPIVLTNSPMQDVVSKSKENSRVLPQPSQINPNTTKAASNGKIAASAQDGVATPRTSATVTSQTQTQITNSHMRSKLPVTANQDDQNRFALPVPRQSRNDHVIGAFMRPESALQNRDHVDFDDSTKIVIPTPIATTPSNRPRQNMITPANRAGNILRQQKVHEKFITQNSTVSPTPQKPKNLIKSCDHYDSSAYDRIVPGITPTPMQKKQRSEDTGSSVEAASKSHTSRVHSNPGEASHPSFSPPAARASESATPKMSNTMEQNTNKKWSSSSFSATSDTFDELLAQFQKDVQEGTDLYGKGENDLLVLEVDLSHALAAALRYKGDMIDLLDDIEDVQAMAEELLADIIE
mmetsp:Transcript_31844/g.60719  ORF Transcript_31844/g.60719 Transcript_31844/m.60719 type:complete len:930 (+) Transcript_31844:86-2875(+)